MNAKKIFVIGCGRWGTFIAWYLDKIGHEVSLYGREQSANMKQLLETGKNQYLSLSKTVRLTTSYEEIGLTDYIVISVGSQQLQSVVSDIAARAVQGKNVILCMKGIEIETGRRLSQIASDALHESNQTAVWLGPGHVQEFCRGVPNCMVIDSYSPELTKFLADSFKSDLIRFYYGNDIIGTEVGAATKNIMGIVAGVLDGLNYVTLKGPLMARGAREVARFTKALGGSEFSAYGLCHLGDYETTLFSPHSHNRRWGEAYVLGQPFEKLAEGVATARAVANVAKRLGVDMPITNAVNEMITKKTPPKELITELFGRTATAEFK